MDFSLWPPHVDGTQNFWEKQFCQHQKKIMNLRPSEVSDFHYIGPLQKLCQVNI